MDSVLSLLCPAQVSQNQNDDYFQATQPYLYALGGAIALYAVQTFKALFTPPSHETRREMIGRWLLKIPSIRAKFKEQMDKDYAGFCNEWEERVEPFGAPRYEIPEEGLSEAELIHIVDAYERATLSKVAETNPSGMLYFPGLKDTNPKTLENYIADENSEVTEGEGVTSFLGNLSVKLEKAFIAAFRCSYLWNSLHLNEFSVGFHIQRQLVRMVGGLYGGDPTKVKGVTTSGGSLSLMTAARAYLKWGMNVKGWERRECVIIAPQTFHAALDKAQDDYGFKLVHVDVDSEGRVDMEAMKKAIKKHKQRLVGVFASAPSYPTGVIDPIEDIAKLTSEAQCGFHVDCCLGGFVSSFLDVHPQFLTIPGVTSLSADTHKNGLGPKGTSVLVTQQQHGIDPAFHACYAVPNWTGGVYGSTGKEGSRSIDKDLCAYLALLGTGKSGYRRIAKGDSQLVQNLSKRIQDELKGQIRIVAPPEVNVAAFKIDEASRLPYGATYALAHEMKVRKFPLNALKGDQLHVCVTSRWLTEDKIEERFTQALKESFKAVSDKVSLGEVLQGDGAIYGTLSQIFEPSFKGESWTKALENWALGIIGAMTLLKNYFHAGL